MLGDGKPLLLLSWTRKPRGLVYARIPVLVGCAPGADAAARAGAPAAQLFRASAWRARGLPWPAALAARSVAFVRALSAAGGVLVSAPGRPCPAGLLPGRSWRSCGSGSWSTLALAAGLAVPLVLFLPPAVSPPAAWGPWSPAPLFVNDQFTQANASLASPLSGAWLLLPPPRLPL